MSSCLSGLCPLYHWRIHDIGSSWCPYPQETHKALRGLSYPLLLQTKTEVKGPWLSQLSALTAIVSTFHQRLCFICEGEDESGLKRLLKCWSTRSSSSGDCEWEGRGCEVRRGLAMFHVLTMFDSWNMCLSPAEKEVVSFMSIRCLVQFWL